VKSNTGIIGQRPETTTGGGVVMQGYRSQSEDNYEDPRGMKGLLTPPTNVLQSHMNNNDSP
jgi:hypothetical protein